MPEGLNLFSPCPVSSLILVIPDKNEITDFELKDVLVC